VRNPEIGDRVVITNGGRYDGHVGEVVDYDDHAPAWPWTVEIEALNNRPVGFDRKDFEILGDESEEDTDIESAGTTLAILHLRVTRILSALKGNV
jgi:hypothetical protein